MSFRDIWKGVLLRTGLGKKLQKLGPGSQNVGSPWVKSIVMPPLLQATSHSWAVLLSTEVLGVHLLQSLPTGGQPP